MSAAELRHLAANRLLPGKTRSQGKAQQQQHNLSRIRELSGEALTNSFGFMDGQEQQSVWVVLARYSKYH